VVEFLSFAILECVVVEVVRLLVTPVDVVSAIRGIVSVVAVVGIICLAVVSFIGFSLVGGLDLGKHGVVILPVGPATKLCVEPEAEIDATVLEIVVGGPLNLVCPHMVNLISEV
jgi:hypothetical protein